jgi:hypothetical protein
MLFDSPFHTFVVLLITGLFAWLSWLVGKRKGRPWAGFWLGLVLGIIGLGITALLPVTHQVSGYG